MQTPLSHQSDDPPELTPLVDKPEHEDKKDHHGEHGPLVVVTIDGNPKHIKKGVYSVDLLKVELGVPVDMDLDQVVDGELRALDGNKEVHIKGGEVFISHVRQGGSS